MRVGAIDFVQLLLGQRRWIEVRTLLTLHSSKCFSHDFALIVESSQFEHPLNERLIFFCQRKCHAITVCQLMAVSISYLPRRPPGPPGAHDRILRRLNHKERIERRGNRNRFFPLRSLRSMRFILFGDLQFGLHSARMKSTRSARSWWVNPSSSPSGMSDVLCA